MGSLYHISPEQIANKAYHGCKLDMWAAGITLYRLLVGLLPFHSVDMNALFAMVSEAKYEIPEYLSAGMILLHVHSIDMVNRGTRLASTTNQYSS